MMMAESTKQRRIPRSFGISDVLLIVIIATGITGAIGQKSLCGDRTGSPTEIAVPFDGKTILSKFDDKKNEEWLFRPSDNISFINVEFLKYELSGPTCTSSSQIGISKLRIKTNSDENWYCKGRRKPDNMSGQGFMQISYCRKFEEGEISFRVTSSCNGTFLVKQSAARIKIPYNRKSTCVVQLVSTDKRMRIKAMLEDVTMEAAKNVKCKGRYIFAEDENGRSLLPGNEEKLCNHETNSNYRDGVTLPVFSRVGSDRIIIGHKKARFSLSLQLMEGVDQPTASTFITEQPRFSNATTNATVGGKLEDSIKPNNETKGYGHIIGIGCGGIFVLFSIILGLFYVRRKKTKRRKSVKSLRLKNDIRGNEAENESPAAVSVQSINNAMYGQILDGQDENFRMTSISPNGILDSDEALNRRDTRPQLPPPAHCSTQDDKLKARTSNIYEKIEDMHTFRGVDSRPMSCATFTSDEFSDDGGLTNDPCNYSVIMNAPFQHTMGNVPQGSAHYDKMNPQISINSAMTFDTDTYINSDTDLHLSKSHREIQREEGSSLLRGEDNMTRYASPRPSLPNLQQIALAEDAENYLSPRPSCPDVMTNGYSSTDDVRELRKRILAAAHPSLLGTSKLSSSSVPETGHYHFPKVANESGPSVHYSTPRRKENYT